MYINVILHDITCIVITDSRRSPVCPWCATRSQVGNEAHSQLSIYRRELVLYAEHLT